MSATETEAPASPSAPRFHRPQVPAPKPLDVDGDRADNLKIWKQRWENYCIITGLLEQAEDYKCAVLLHSIGIDVIRIFNGLKFDGEDRNIMADMNKKLTNSFWDKCSSSVSKLTVGTRRLVSQSTNMCPLLEIWLRLTAFVTEYVNC